MRVETMKKLVLTKEEKKVIHDLYKILNEDNSLNVAGVWDILADIYIGDDSNDNMAAEYGYKIEFID